MSTLEQIAHAMLLPILYIIFLCILMEASYTEFSIQYDYNTLLHSGGVLLVIVVVCGWLDVTVDTLRRSKNEP